MEDEAWARGIETVSFAKKISAPGWRASLTLRGDTPAYLLVIGRGSEV